MFTNPSFVFPSFVKEGTPSCTIFILYLIIMAVVETLQAGDPALVAENSDVEDFKDSSVTHCLLL